MALWLSAQPLVLASRSAARRDILTAAGLPAEICPADLDERAIERELADAEAAEIAMRLALEKAKAVAATMPARIVIGADQVLALGRKRFSKPADRSAAVGQLRALRGQTHTLYSAVAVARDEHVLFQHVDVARLTMREISDGFIAGYLDQAGADAMTSVGAYQLEKTGIHLFERVEGDHFTILGLPLLPLLQFFRHAGFVSE